MNQGTVALYQHDRHVNTQFLAGLNGEFLLAKILIFIADYTHSAAQVLLLLRLALLLSERLLRLWSGHEILDDNGNGLRCSRARGNERLGNAQESAEGHRRACVHEYFRVFVHCDARVVLIKFGGGGIGIERNDLRHHSPSEW